MGREIDKRKHGVNRITPARSNYLHERARAVSESLPGDHTISIESFDPATGNPCLVASECAPAEKGNYVERALSHVQRTDDALGLEETQAPEFKADPNVQISSSGAATVHIQQEYKGIRIFQAAQGVRFRPDGAISEKFGSPVTVPHELEVRPKLSVKDAVSVAARYVAAPKSDEQGETDEFGQSFSKPTVTLDDFVPKIIATFPNKPDASTVLEAGPFGDKITANLIWFPLDGELRLAWETLITMPDCTGQYRTFVDADSGEILYCSQLMSTVAAEGNVFVVDGSGGRQVVRFPRPLTDYNVPVPSELPDAFPDHWVALNGACGNAVNAFMARTGVTFQGIEQNGILTLNPDDPEGDDQKILNIFYYNCFIHDFLYMYGFREADGNFQQDNFGRGGLFTDPVTAFAHPGQVDGTASMTTTRIDGVSPIMNMGLVVSTNRHTAFDSTVVFHEFMHGVTNRLVGGPMNTHALDAHQSRAMGEGWGDYIACTINNTTVVGAWVVDKPGGIRKFPYDSDFPDHFGMLGTGRYNRPELSKQHAVGEIWCATLIEMNRKIGAHLGVQLVIDALKLSPATPSFIDMRDSILRALDNKRSAHQLTDSEYKTARDGIWAAFAKFGMGANAISIGASLVGVVADFNVPVENESGAVRPATDPPAGPQDALSGAAPSAGDSSHAASLTGNDVEHVSASVEPTYPLAYEPDPETRLAFDDVLAAIKVHGEELVNIPNVVSVRPSFRFRDGRITSQPALAVTVLRKVSPESVPARNLVPAKLGKVLVDVAPATPFEQWRYLERLRELAAAGLQAPAGTIDTRLPFEEADLEAMAELGGLQDYVPPDEPLALVEEEMTVICHASPDTGWRNLKDFINGTQNRLTATMYEFNARHVLNALADALTPPRNLRLILDGGAANERPGPPATTVSKREAREALENGLKNRFECVWAPVLDDGLTTASYYPTAYHIKVAVRDGESVWLSSGNWKESGQPRLDPINGPLPPDFKPSEFQSEHNREWHVIIQNRSLAELFETFINHDIEQAEPLQIVGAGALPSPPPLPDLFIPEAGLAALTGFGPEPEFFKEMTFTKKVRVQPLLTPDNFPELVTPLIKGAKKSLYFQNQSLKPSQLSRYGPLFLALRDKSQEARTNPQLDVKILVSEFANLPLLSRQGFEMSHVKKQYQCHNKGIIIDDEVVIVGSHNWTGQGATRNRDASLIFYDAEIAGYFRKLFMYDWNRVSDADEFMLSMPLVALPDEATPPGMRRVAWTDVFPDWREEAL